MLHQLLQQVSARLRPVSETAGLDAQVLLAHILGQARAWVLAHPETALTPSQQEALESALSRLERGEPLPYVLGHWEFFGLEFAVGPAVLIPRPETELLVERAMAWLKAHPGRRRAADAGTGSGCIAVSLAVHVPDLSVAATDLSIQALRVARANGARHQVSPQVGFVQADLLAPLAQFDLICANLPYIPEDTLRGLPVARHEPPLALNGGPDGLAAIRRLLQSAPAHLHPGGLALLEIEASQGEAARLLAEGAFPEAEVRVLPDLAGRDRLLAIQT